jgi:hypothetical protein
VPAQQPRFLLAAQPMSVESASGAFQPGKKGEKHALRQISGHNLLIPQPDPGKTARGILQ